MSEATLEGEVMDEPGAELELRRSADPIIRPIATAEQIAESFREFRRMERELLDQRDNGPDYQVIRGKRSKTRSGYRKLSTAFGIDLSVVDRVITRSERDGKVDYAEFVVRATAPNGRAVEGWGACDRYERCCEPGCKRTGQGHSHCPARESKPCPGFTHFAHANHDIPATAETRAKNRALEDLFGTGKESAEEQAGEGEPARKTAPRRGPSKITPGQHGRIGGDLDRLAEAYGKPQPEVLELVRAYMEREFGKSSRNELSSEQASALIDELARWLTEGLPE